MEFATTFLRLVYCLSCLTSSVVWSQQPSNGAQIETESTSWIHGMIPENYNHKETPSDGYPAEVKVVLRPWAIGHISLQQMHFFINLYIKLTWVDYRLQIANDTKRTITLPEDIAKRLWVPEVAFRNCMSCEIVKFNPGKNILSLMGNELSFLVRQSATLFCSFDVTNYPMDSHHCSIEVQSANKFLDQQVLVNDMKDHAFLRKSSLPQFTITDLSSGNCSQDIDTSGHFISCIEYRMKFIRQMTYHVMLTYAPCLLIVVLTWISFWLDIELAAPRVALGLTCLLTLSTQFASAQKDLPPVSYLKAVDVWFITCMFMVFASLVEYAISFTFMKLEKSQNALTNESSRVENQTTPHVLSGAKRMPVSKQIDYYSKICFPLFFIIFNICYWGYYGTR